MIEQAHALEYAKHTLLALCERIDMQITQTLGEGPVFVDTEDLAQLSAWAKSHLEAELRMPEPSAVKCPECGCTPPTDIDGSVICGHDDYPGCPAVETARMPEELRKIAERHRLIDGEPMDGYAQEAHRDRATLLRHLTTPSEPKK